MRRHGEGNSTQLPSRKDGTLRRWPKEDHDHEIYEGNKLLWILMIKKRGTHRRESRISINLCRKQSATSSVISETSHQLK